MVRIFILILFPFCAFSQTYIVDKPITNKKVYEYNDTEKCDVDYSNKIIITQKYKTIFYGNLINSYELWTYVSIDRSNPYCVLFSYYKISNQKNINTYLKREYNRCLLAKYDDNFFEKCD